VNISPRMPGNEQQRGKTAIMRVVEDWDNGCSGIPL
jgi:hypothetical protein